MEVPLKIAVTCELSVLHVQHAVFCTHVNVKLKRAYIYIRHFVLIFICSYAVVCGVYMYQLEAEQRSCIDTSVQAQAREN